MASERVTLGDIRATAKAADGIRTDWWTPGDPSDTLPETLQEMATDISKWFHPKQGWNLAGVRMGFISPQRIDQSMGKLSVVKLKANRQEADQFTPVFHFSAERPPMRTMGFLRRNVLDFPKVFAPNFTDRVDIWSEGNANVYPAHIGQVYPLGQTLKELSSPYYLVGTTVSVSHGEDGRKLEPPKRLVVMVYMRDLLDYTKLEINRLKRVYRQLGKKFPPIQPA